MSVSDAPFAYLPVCLGLVGSALSQSGLSTLVLRAKVLLCSVPGGCVRACIPGVLAGVGGYGAGGCGAVEVWPYKDACGRARKNGVKGHRPYPLIFRGIRSKYYIGVFLPPRCY